MGWGDAWAGLSQQAFGFAVDTLRSRQQNKFQTQREEAARKAAEQQEAARRAWEQKMMDKQANLNRQQKDSEVAQTFIDPQTGAVVPITRGQISSGKATVPQFELERQRAEAAIMAQGEALRTQKIQAEIDAARARAEQARAGAGLSRARTENPERFRAESSTGQMNDRAVDTAIQAEMRALAKQKSDGTFAVPAEIRNRAVEFLNDPEATPAEKLEALRRLNAMRLQENIPIR